MGWLDRLRTVDPTDPRPGNIAIDGIVDGIPNPLVRLTESSRQLRVYSNSNGQIWGYDSITEDFAFYPIVDNIAAKIISATGLEGYSPGVELQTEILYKSKFEYKLLVID